MSVRRFTMLITTNLFMRILKKKFGKYKKQSTLVKDFLLHHSPIPFINRNFIGNLLLKHSEFPPEDLPFF